MTAAEALGLTEQLCHGPVRISALHQAVTVTPVACRDVVRGAQGGVGSYHHALLTHADVKVSADHSLQEAVGGGFFKPAHGAHILEEL